MKNIHQNEFEGNQKKNTTSATTTATPKNTNRNRFQCSHANPHIKRINATKYALRHYANAVRCPIWINLFSIHIVSSLYGHDYAVQINIIFWMLLLALFSRCLSLLIHLHKLLKILCDYYDFFVFVFVFVGMDFFSVFFFLPNQNQIYYYNFEENEIDEHKQTTTKKHTKLNLSLDFCLSYLLYTHCVVSFALRAATHMHNAIRNVKKTILR